jgi:hypothetical protein
VGWFRRGLPEVDLARKGYKDFCIGYEDSSSSVRTECRPIEGSANLFLLGLVVLAPARAEGAIFKFQIQDSR